MSDAEWNVTELTGYAQQRESRRMQSVWMSAVFIVLAGGSATLHGLGPVLRVLLAVVAVLAAVLLAAMLVPRRPAQLTSPSERVAGRWPATMQAISFAVVTQRHPNMNDFAELTGHIVFDANGVTWRASPRFQREYGSLERSWAGPIRIEARRLRGIGSQVHVAIASSDSKQADDIWLRNARNFPI